MLPTGKKDKTTATQIIIYTIWTIACSLIPVFGKTGVLHITPISAVLVFGLGLYMLKEAVNLYHVAACTTTKVPTLYKSIDVTNVVFGGAWRNCVPCPAVLLLVAFLLWVTWCCFSYCFCFVFPVSPSLFCFPFCRFFLFRLSLACRTCEGWTK